MINDITLENLSTKESLRLSTDGDGKFILDEEGVDWGSVKASIYTYKSPKQVGNEISGVEVESRTVLIVGWIYGTEEQIQEAQFWLGTFIIPTEQMRLKVKEYHIIGQPTSIPQFGKSKQQNNEYMCRFIISLYCGNPEFVRSNPNVIGYGTTKPGFTFPFHFLEDGPGITFGTVEVKTVQKVVNAGIHATGGIITFKCLGESIRNPKLFDVYDPTKYILINKTLTYGEVVTINTHNNEQDVTGVLENIESDYFRYWDFNNAWIQFERGVSYFGIEYEGPSNALEVQIEFSDSYLAIEGM